MELKDIIEKLAQNRNYTRCFINGALVDLPEDNFIETVNKECFWEGCSEVIKKIGGIIMEKKDVLLNAAGNANRQSDYELEKDITFCSEIFAYYSRLVYKIESERYKIMQPKQGLSGMILEDCPIFTTLGLLIAGSIAYGVSICLYVNSTYSVISVYFAKMLLEAGLPNGVVNVVPNFDKKSIPLIASHRLEIIGVIPEDIPKGEFHFNKAIVKKTSLQPIIVLKSADIDSAIDSIITCTQSNEVLWFPNVIYVEEPCYEKFLQCLKFVVENRNASYAWKGNTFDIDQMLEKFIKNKKNSGVEVIELVHKFLKCAFLFNDDAALSFPIICDEEKSSCHHVISIIPIRTAQEALSFANSSSGGLAVSLWTNDAVEIMSLPFKLKYGTIWVNSANRYSPTVPFTPRDCFGYGTFSGKRGFLENSIYFDDNLDIVTKNYLYPKERNASFPKKDIQSVTKQSLSAFASWQKMSNLSKASFLETVAHEMEITWNSHYKTIFNQTDEQTWNKAISYTKFLASYSVDTVYQQQSFYDKGFQIISCSEPIGVIAIVADQVPIDELIFLISAGLLFGNAVIVGISKNEKSSIIAAELENLFKAKLGLVNVIVDADKDLLSQFVCNGDISSIWISKYHSKHSGVNCGTFRKIVKFGSLKIMTEATEIYEIHATKQKSIWLPSLY